MSEPAVEAPRKRRRRRSPAFMARVYSVLDAYSDMPFIEAVKYVQAHRDEWEAEDRARAREAMRRQNQLDTWNATSPPGTIVMVRFKVGDPEFPSRTRSQAWMAGGTPLVLVEGRTGGYDLDFVRAVLPPPAS